MNGELESIPTPSQLMEVKKEPLDNFFEESNGIEDVNENKDTSILSQQDLSFSATPFRGNGDGGGGEKPKQERPTWFPSRTGRSIVWDHINWLEESKRAACNYCTAEFQIKGGTSAVLRHLKSNHPQMIDFDPETAVPVKRKKRKTEEPISISDDTRSYVDNLLKQFLPDNELDGTIASTSTNGDVDPMSKADSEIDEVLRSLYKEQNREPSMDKDDQDLRKILGILDKPAVIEDIGVNPHGISKMDKEEQSSSSSIGGPSEESPPLEEQQEQVSMSLLSSIRRPQQPPTNNGTNSNSTIPPSMSVLLSSNSTTNNPNIAKQLAQPSSALDYESKILYNRSLSATIAREDAMRKYYETKTKLLKMEISKQEKERKIEESRSNGSNSKSPNSSFI